ncbi:hypothetical protein SL1157_0751 [Ruegeria lacuscaerulensis ITI-1157]|nr:hypothetical protein SL1157_0751 [Ruegeria lacuscaerulensis ITI-1157]
MFERIVFPTCAEARIPRNLAFWRGLRINSGAGTFPGAVGPGLPVSNAALLHLELVRERLDDLQVQIGPNRCRKPEAGAVRT